MDTYGHLRICLMSNIFSVCESACQSVATISSHNSLTLNHEQPAQTGIDKKRTTRQKIKLCPCLLTGRPEKKDLEREISFTFIMSQLLN